jgi:ribonuclease VapC
VTERRFVVLDAFALLAYFREDAAGPRVEQILRSGDGLYMCSVNLGEVFYKTMREYDVTRGRFVLAMIARDPIEIIDPDRELVLAAAYLKGLHAISYADCFAAALAQRLDATLVTGDSDFARLEPDVKIEWLPA